MTTEKVMDSLNENEKLVYLLKEIEYLKGGAYSLSRKDEINMYFDYLDYNLKRVKSIIHHCGLLVLDSSIKNLIPIIPNPNEPPPFSSEDLETIQNTLTQLLAEITVVEQAFTYFKTNITFTNLDHMQVDHLRFLLSPIEGSSLMIKRWADQSFDFPGA